MWNSAKKVCTNIKAGFKNLNESSCCEKKVWTIVEMSCVIPVDNFENCEFYKQGCQFKITNIF